MAAINIDGFSDLELIGRGGFATVYAATQDRFGRRVALKILDLTLDDSGRSRFERECLATGMLSDHPNVVTVYDAGETPDGRPYLALEHLGGGTLKDLLTTGGTLRPDRVAAIGAAVANALAAAHRLGILHRDVKPSNVLLNDDQFPKLADFGISRLTSDPRYAHASTASYSPEHVSPEQLTDDELTAAADVYSLGSTLYTLLEGRSPFATGHNDTIHQLLTRKVAGNPPTFSPQTPSPLRRLLAATLDHDPTRRPTATEVGRTLSDLELDPQDAAAGAGRPAIIIRPVDLAAGEPAVPVERLDLSQHRHLLVDGHEAATPMATTPTGADHHLWTPNHAVGQAQSGAAQHSRLRLVAIAAATMAVLAVLVGTAVAVVQLTADTAENDASPPGSVPTGDPVSAETSPSTTGEPEDLARNGDPDPEPTTQQTTDLIPAIEPNPPADRAASAPASPSDPTTDGGDLRTVYVNHFRAGAPLSEGEAGCVADEVDASISLSRAWTDEVSDEQWRTAVMDAITVCIPAERMAEIWPA